MRHGFFFLVFLITSFFGFSEEKTIFPFSKSPIDVVIPSDAKDIPTLEQCIRGIRENGANIRRIVVVSKKRFTDQAEWFDESNYPFSFQDVASALANRDPDLEKLLFQKGSRTGWYFQQLLKLYAFFVIPDLSPNVLILDADTVFLQPVTFLNQEGGGMYNPGTEYHIPYFEHAARLLPGFQRLFPEYSGVSHHMLFQRPVIEALFEEVEEMHGAPFWQVFCQLVDRQHLWAGASEYEIYFNYVFSHTNQVSIRKLKWKNIHKQSHIAKYKKKKKHYVCLHSYERKK